MTRVTPSARVHRWPARGHLDDPTRTGPGCPVVHLNPAEGGKRPGEWASTPDGLRGQGRLLYSDFGPGFFLATRHEECTGSARSGWSGTSDAAWAAVPGDGGP